MTRTSGAELPSEQELRAILEKESPRTAVRYDYTAKNPHLFDAYRGVARDAGVDTYWIQNFPQLALS